MTVSGHCRITQCCMNTSRICAYAPAFALFSTRGLCLTTLGATMTSTRLQENFREELCDHPRYEQVKFIEHGGSSSVVLAQDKLSGKLVALKFIKRSLVGRNRCAEREILNQMRLHHPHVISLNEVFLTQNHLVLVIEYAAGGDLVGIVPAGQGISEAQARWVFQQILFALEYCHRMGVASRDVKLENVLLMDSSAAPIIKLADFGLSTEVKSSCCLCSGVVGTPTYLSPEVLTSKPGRLYDVKKTDVWSCGVLLYAMLAGCCPFQRPSDADLNDKERTQIMLRRILRLDYELPPELSDDCKDLISRMLVEDPSKRPSMRELLQHPWCFNSEQSGAILRCNDNFVITSRANAPPTKMVEEVRKILREAVEHPGALPAHSFSGYVADAVDKDMACNCLSCQYEEARCSWT